MQEIIPPTNCPSCDSVLKWENDILYCVNDSCESRTQKSVEHWGKTLKIKGLGPKTIEKLELGNISELYWLEERTLQDLLNSEKMGTKLFNEIKKSEKSSLNQVMPAFGIPLIGKSASDKLCKVITEIEEISEATAKQAGLGPKAVSNLLKWKEEKYPLIELTFKPKSEVLNDKPVTTKGIVCISGKLKSYKTKAEAEKVLNKLGYKVKSSLTKDVTILINESGIESAKTTKARVSGVTIVEDLNEFLGE